MSGRAPAILAPARAEPAVRAPLPEASGLGGDGEAGSAYASLIVEDVEAELPLWHRRWLGRILVWHLPCGTVYIGPHWYCSILMLAFIIGVGCFHCSSAVHGGPWQLLGGILVTVLSTWTFLRCALANPGVLLPVKGAVEELPVEAPPLGVRPSRRHSGVSPGGRRCDACNLVQPRGCSHCEFCQVCIEGFDHHCPWMGKCIGKDNLCAFYSFITVGFSSLAYIFILTVLGSPTAQLGSVPPPQSQANPLRVGGTRL